MHGQSGQVDVVVVGGGEFGPEAADRRRRFGQRVREGSDPELKFAFAANPLGPDDVPAFAFEQSMREKVLQ